MLTAPLLGVLAALLVLDRGSCTHWGYSGEFGPHNWVSADTSPNINQCGGKFQSPVDFDDRYSEFDPSLGEITYSGYNQELYNPYIVNNGHTVQVSATEDANRYIEGAGLPGRFQFAQFHYHWGSNSSRGAEHTVRGFQYPLELHLVHFNQKYGSLAESLKYNDGLAVLGVFFEVGPTANEDLSVIVEALKDVRLSDKKGANLQQPVVLSRFLPRRTRDFFRYTGSLTTPPCSEVVTFTIFTTTVPISEEQLQQFRLLRTGSEGSPPLVNNFRPTFPLNGRRVFRSFSSSATRPGVGPEGFPSLQGSEEDSYDILDDSGFGDRFRELVPADALVQGVGEVVRRCNLALLFGDWSRHRRVCAPIWNAFPQGPALFGPGQLSPPSPASVGTPGFTENPAYFYQLAGFGKKKKK